MLKKNLIFGLAFGLILNIALEANSQITGEPDIKKTGLTLSGGGAKGLAHIGVLHILDSLGIQVEVITGTSMGSIVGGMYAAGYSASEIENFATGIDWATLFSAKSSLSYLPPQDRNSESKSTFEVSINKGKAILPTGAIEGQQLWNTLNEIFLPVYQINNFNELPIPFACVATDVETGLPVVMKDGNISSAIRASMAIPSVFTTVTRDGKKLIDGGVVKNFPVSVAKEMGADFVIGVNVSQGLRRSDEINTPIDIIYQMGFYVDAHNFSGDKNLTNIYIEPDLTGFSAASFGDAASIIERGKTAARSQMKSLLDLAQKLKSQKADNEEILKPKNNHVFVIDTVIISGNSYISKSVIIGRLGIRKGDSLLPASFSNAVTRVYASNYFDKVNYSLIPSGETGKVSLHLEVTEKPKAAVMAGLNFSSFNGIGIMAGWRTRRLLIDNVQAYGRILIGKNPSFKTGISAYVNPSQKNWISLDAEGIRFEFPVYEKFRPVSNYRQVFTGISLSLGTITGKNSYSSLGTSFFRYDLKPKILADITIDGNNNGFETYFKWNYHTLNRNAFPLSGQKFNFQASYIHNQNPSLVFTSYQDDNIVLIEPDIEISNFFQTFINYEAYKPGNERLTHIFRIQSGYNFNYNQGFLNNFNVGGTSSFLQKQIIFSGLNDYEIITQSALTGLYGLQYDMGKNLFITGLLNAGMYDFYLEKLNKVNYQSNAILGGGLSLGYLSLLGPIEIIFSYSPQTDKIIGYVNIGWAF